MAARMLNKLWRRGSIGRVRVKVVGWGVGGWWWHGRREYKELCMWCEYIHHVCTHDVNTRTTLLHTYVCTYVCMYE